MVKNNKYILGAAVMVLCVISACDDPEITRQGPIFKRLPELAEITPKKPVKVKLKRHISGNYSWELSGDDAGKIVEMNNILKKSIEEDE
jgi:hypothetical protein